MPSVQCTRETFLEHVRPELRQRFLDHPHVTCAAVWVEPFDAEFEKTDDVALRIRIVTFETSMSQSDMVDFTKCIGRIVAWYGKD